MFVEDNIGTVSDMLGGIAIDMAISGAVEGNMRGHLSYMHML